MEHDDKEELSGGEREKVQEGSAGDPVIGISDGPGVCIQRRRDQKSERGSDEKQRRGMEDDECTVNRAEYLECHQRFRQEKECKEDVRPSPVPALDEEDAEDQALDQN